MMKRTITLALGMAWATGAMAGTLDLTSTTYASLYDYVAQSNVSTDTETISGTYSGASISGSLSTVANAAFGADSSSAGNSVSGATTSETSGWFIFQDGFNLNASTYGSVEDTQGSLATYTFTTRSASVLDLVFAAGYTSSGYMSSGIGLWDYELFVDGVEYPASGITTPPDPSGSWLIPLGAGTHQIQAYSNGNVGTSPGVGQEEMNETVYFTAQATPEPAPFAMLGIGLVGLMVRRRKMRR